MQTRTSIPAPGQELDLKENDPASYLQHQVKILYELLPTTQWVHIAAIFTVFGLLFKYVDLTTLLIWLGFVVSILVTRIWIHRRYALSRKSIDDSEYWFNWFLVGTTLYGIMWSATAILLVPPEWTSLAGITALILCGLAAGGVAVSVVSLKVYYAYTISIVLPYAAFLIATKQEPYFLIGCLMAAFTAVIMIVAIHVNQFFSNLIDLQLKINLLDKEIQHESQKRQFAEKALLNNTLEEELAELIRQQSYKIRNSEDLARVSSKDKNEVQKHYYEMLTGTFRSQLDSVIGFIGELNKNPLPIKQSTIVNIIEKILRSMKKAIRDLDKSGDYEDIKVDAANAIEKINLRFMLNEISTKLPLALKAKYISLNRNYDKDIPHELYGNRKALQKILKELILNAAKFSDGGVIDINVSIVNNEKDKMEVAFLIKDTGIGLPVEVIDYLNEGINEDQFIGSGLATIKHLLESMGSDLSVDSIRGVGTQMKFTYLFLKEKSELTNKNRENTAISG